MCVIKVCKLLLRSSTPQIPRNITKNVTVNSVITSALKGVLWKKWYTIWLSRILNDLVVIGSILENCDLYTNNTWKWYKAAPQMACTLYHWKERFLCGHFVCQNVINMSETRNLPVKRDKPLSEHVCVAMVLTLLIRHTPLMEEQEAGKRDKNLASVKWMSKLITLPVWEPCAPESGKRKMGLKWWIKDEWGSPGFRLRLIRWRIAVLSSMAEQWRPACEVSAWCFSASSRGNESHYCQCGVSFMAQTGLDSASDIVSIHW